MGLLSDIVNVVGKGANTVAQDAGQGAHLLSGLFKGGGNSKNSAPLQNSAPLTPMNNPLSAGNVEGTIASKNASDVAGFTPNFLQSLLKAMPYQQQQGEHLLVPGAGAQYDPGSQRILLGQADPATLAHENLHNVWFHQNPQQQQSENALLKSLPQTDKSQINKILGTPLYGNGNVNTPDLATEVHSYAGTQGYDLPQSISNYYNQYFPQGKLDDAENNYWSSQASPKYLATNLGVEGGGLLPYLRQTGFKN